MRTPENAVNAKFGSAPVRQTRIGGTRPGYAPSCVGDCEDACRAKFVEVPDPKTTDCRRASVGLGMRKAHCFEAIAPSGDRELLKK